MLALENVLIGKWKFWYIFEKFTLKVDTPSESKKCTKQVFTFVSVYTYLHTYLTKI